MSEFLSKKDIVREFILCGKDPVYFIDNYCKISHPIRGQLPFKLWPFQKKLLTDFNDYQHNIILKSRQLGATWVAAAYASWLMLFHREKSIMVVATKFGTAGNLVKKVKGMIKNLPPFFQQLAVISTDNRTSFILSNGSEIKASSTATDVGRSESLSLLIVDEAAHIPNLDELWTALGPVLAAGGRSILISSPKGVGGFFHEAYIRADKGENEFHPIKLDWKVHPERDEEWERKERRRLQSDRKFDQEYNCSFLASGETVIDPEILNKIYNSIKKPIAITGPDRNMFLWEHYNKNNNYLVVADVARGDGTDFSTIQLFNIETMEQAGEYKGKISIDAFAKLVYDVGDSYGHAMIVVENNVGMEVCNKLIQLEYPNLYYAEKGSHEYVPPYQANLMENVIPGFTTSMKTRPWVISRLEESLRTGQVVVNSERTYKELETFIWNKGKAESMKGHNDDLVMALAITCWVRDTALKESVRGLNYKKTCLKNIYVARREFNTAIPGMNDYNPKKAIFKSMADEKRKQLSRFFRG